MPQPVLYGQENNTLQIRDFGEEKCQSTHTYGPATRNLSSMSHIADFRVVAT